MLRNLKGSSYFSAIDLNQGFYQIPIKKEDQCKTSFVLPWGQYEYTVMPFGLTNALRTFQRIMNLIFSDLKQVKVYMDDLLIHSSDEKTHLNDINLVLKILFDSNISVNFDKSVFGKSELIYLGHIIDNEGIKANTIKLKETIANLRGETRKDVQKINGLLNWFRPFIPILSIKINFLTDKLKKDCKFRKLN
ncbi:Retrovirus-related Pol polyprotein from transposon [Dictyocoela muelleri]|nr:Retrovirus-related Pol polyprotein from transposon [Dictyocoela muelleri]